MYSRLDKFVKIVLKGEMELHFPCDWKSLTAFNFVIAQFWQKITLHMQNSAWWKTGSIKNEYSKS